jgi:hypothetical protein
VFATELPYMTIRISEMINPMNRNIMVFGKPLLIRKTQTITKATVIIRLIMIASLTGGIALLASLGFAKPWIANRRLK